MTLALIHQPAAVDVLPVDDADTWRSAMAASLWPVHGLDCDPIAALARARACGQAAILATLYAVEGSAPRDVGAQMVFAGRSVAGSLSSGCIEADVACHAREVMRSQRPQHLRYGQGSPWRDIQLACGASLDIFLEHIPTDDRAAQVLLHERDRRRSTMWHSDGSERFCVASEHTAGTPLMIQNDPFVLRHRHDPPFRPLVFGQDATVLALATLAIQCGIATTIIAPHGPSAAPPVAGVAYVRETASSFLKRTPIDAWTAVIAATHDGQIDGDIAANALGTPGAFVGVLGSRSRGRQVHSRLQESGVDGVARTRMRLPVGLPGMGKLAFEIAASILGELLHHRAAGRGRSISDNRGVV